MIVFSVVPERRVDARKRERERETEAAACCVNVGMSDHRFQTTINNNISLPQPLADSADGEDDDDDDSQRRSNGDQ